MPDLKRFDFHVDRFMNSYSVDLMNSSEVGQYVLLLCKSWQLDKECCLPDDLEWLARQARVPEISPKVLAKFPTVETEHGTMRRNEPLYEEWQRAVSRSNEARLKAAGRGEKWADAALEKTGMPVLLLTPRTSNAEAHAAASVSPMPIPYQPIPIQSNPNQPTNTTGGVVFDSENRSQVKLLGEWKNLAVRHKRWFGSQASASHKDKYADACSKYGEDVVLASFDEWVVAGAKQWAERNDVKQPLFAFWKQLPDLAETNKQIAEADAEDKQKAVAHEAEKTNLAAATEALVQQQMHAHHEFMNNEAPKQNEGDPEEYFKE